MVVGGIGFHHAGLDPGDRQVMEQLFLEGILPVLVSTTTLAMGVNLPAHLVIVKSTTHMENGECREYSESQVCRLLKRVFESVARDCNIQNNLSTRTSVHFHPDRTQQILLDSRKMS